MRDAVRRIYHERRAITASLKDVGSAVAKLDAVLLSVMLMIFIFICLLIFNKSNTLQSLVPLATIVLGFSFIFGHSAQTLFESVSLANSYQSRSEAKRRHSSFSSFQRTYSTLAIS